MRQVLLLAAVPVAFLAGLAAARTTPAANAQVAGLQAQIIDLAAMTDAEIGAVIPNFGTLRTRTLVTLPEGTIGVQAGDGLKHTHAGSNEFQYVISGSGTFWLGDQPREIHAGDLIVIPKGTVHSGSVASGGELKVLAIKMPPQAAGDTHLVP